MQRCTRGASNERCALRSYVRFTPESGHGSARSRCPLCAKSRHWPNWKDSLAAAFHCPADRSSVHIEAPNADQPLATSTLKNPWKLVVHAQLEQVDRLLHRDILYVDHRDCREWHRRAADPDMVVFERRRPVAGDSIFEPGPGSPTFRGQAGVSCAVAEAFCSWELTTTACQMFPDNRAAAWL